MRKAWLFLLLRLISDLILINLCFISGYLIRFGEINLFTAPVLVYLKFLAFVSMLWLIMFNLTGLYKMQNGERERPDGILAVSFGVFSSAFFTYIFAFFFYREAIYSRAIIIYASILALVMINLARFLLWKLYAKSGG